MLTGVIKLCLMRQSILEVNGRVDRIIALVVPNPLNSPQFLSLVPERIGALISMDHLQSTIGSHQKVVHQMRQSCSLVSSMQQHIHMSSFKFTWLLGFNMSEWTNQYRTLRK